MKLFTIKSFPINSSVFNWDRMCLPPFIMNLESSDTIGSTKSYFYDV